MMRKILVTRKRRTFRVSVRFGNAAVASVLRSTPTCSIAVNTRNRSRKFHMRSGPTKTWMSSAKIFKISSDENQQRKHISTVSYADSISTPCMVQCNWRCTLNPINMALAVMRVYDKVSKYTFFTNLYDHLLRLLSCEALAVTPDHNEVDLRTLAHSMAFTQSLVLLAWRAPSSAPSSGDAGSIDAGDSGTTSLNSSNCPEPRRTCPSPSKPTAPGTLSTAPSRRLAVPQPAPPSPACGL
mmetsp:Transcript_20440/g.54715  ORF Transcript_20440/g.54715 Transcript_20440/m.54715 type:complete len:240 (+) Transcript_20440:1060-1779(+)